VRVALSVACFDDVLFPGTAKAVTVLLERLGHEVAFPPGQTCCGQFHWTAGYHREAAGLARSHTAAFEGCEVVVAPSASCAATSATTTRRSPGRPATPDWRAPPRPSPSTS
jgi:L-lactate dehydrogenase complex protein LldE